MKNRLLTVLWILLLSLMVYRPAPGQNAPTRTLSVPNLTVQISLVNNYAGQPMLIEDFSTDDPNGDSVLCVAGHLDLEYVLHDSSGDVVPINRDASKMHSDIPPMGGGGGNVPGAPDPCKTIRIAKTERRLLLTDLYPGLPHGTYTLQITLAPRGSSDRAEAAPITLSI